MVMAVEEVCIELFVILVDDRLFDSLAHKVQRSVTVQSSST